MSDFSKSKLEGIQVLRAVAAFLVLWCHLKYNLGIPSGQVQSIPSLRTDWGGIGVDIFFIISGFVIAMTASNLGRDWQGFLIRRIARIVPLYFAVSSFMIIWVLVSGAIHHDHSSKLSFNQVFNTYLFLPFFDMKGFTNPVNTNGWTLCFEMWFYLCFGVLMKFFGGKNAGRYLPACLLAGVLVTASFYRGDWYLPKFLFNPMTLEFCAGCLLFHMKDTLARRGSFTLWALIIAGSLLLYESSHFQFLGANLATLDDQRLSWDRAGVWGGFAFCLVGAVTQIDLRYKFPWPRWMLLLGDASYSIYLIFPLIVWPLGTYNHYFGATSISIPPVLFGTFFVLGSAIGGILTWRYFELPTTAKVRTALEKCMLKANKFLCPFLPGFIK